MEERLVDLLEERLGARPVSWSSLSGGDVARSRRVELDDDRVVFVKTHDAPPPGFFTTEAAGLRWLGETGTVRVPEVLSVDDDPPTSPWSGSPRALRPRRPEADLGRALAALHRAGAPAFGREDRRTTGSRGLPNEPCETWVEFYATQRLIPLARLARDGRALDPDVVRRIDRVADRLDDLGGPPAPPARLHGDLWSGNRLVDVDGASWLIDPAAHGGHREFDLAMMRLFGGFGEECFGVYADEYPLADGWRERIPLHQLAPLVVHAIKFGGGYVGAVERALDALR